MDFLTIHEASREFDLPSRVVRYRLHQLIQAGKLVEGPDYQTRVPASVHAAHLNGHRLPAGFDLAFIGRGVDSDRQIAEITYRSVLWRRCDNYFVSNL